MQASTQGKVLNIEDFKGRKALKEFYKDFVYCPKCMGLLHWIGSSCLTQQQLSEAITFPIYRIGKDVYFLNERVMIDFARQSGIVK